MHISKPLTIACALALLVPALSLPRAAASVRALTPLWDVKDTSQPGQLSIFNTDEQGSQLGMPVGSGDLDGDGFDDVVVAPFYAPSGSTNNRLGGGRLHVYFGSAGALSGAVIDQSAPPAKSVDVWGARGGDFLGSELAVEDVTGDGLADVLACAENADGFDTDLSRLQAGALYIIPGRASWPSRIDMASASGAGVTQILGAHGGDRLGFWTAAGDVNGDGINDVLVSADLAHDSSQGPSRPGVLYIIPGRASFPARIDLANAAQVRDLGITTVYGIDDKDHFGSCMTTGDFDSDGIADVAVSAGVSRAGAGLVDYGVRDSTLGQGGGDGPSNDRSGAGEVYILYGRASWPATIQMSSPPSDAAIFWGEQAGGFFGEDLHAGDFDGDGKEELAVGALLASAPGRPHSGIGYLFYGASLARGERLDLASEPNTSTRVSRIYGQRANDIGADSILLGDVDGDGLADLLFGSPSNTPMNRTSAGDMKVLYGTRDRLPPVVDTANPGDVAIFQMFAADPQDMFTYSLAVGDVDGDGILDMIPNAMGGDGLQNRHDLAGDCYVVSGREFSARAGRGGTLDDVPCITSVTATPQQKKYFAGQPGIELTIRCDSSDTSMQYLPGAVVAIRGVEVPTTYVGPNELHVLLDDAPSVLNAPGSLTVQVRNPTSALSAAILSITLLGPEIHKIKAKAETGGFAIKITGKNFLPGATVAVTDASGAPVAVASVTVSSSKKIVAHVAAGTVPSGTVLTVTVLNPGPAPSAPATVTAP